MRCEGATTTVADEKPLRETPGAASGSPTVAFETLGCKLNQYETDSIATTLHKKGFRVVPLQPGADAYIVNSCTVTNKADRKSRNALYRAERFAEEASRPAGRGSAVTGPRKYGTDRGSRDDNAQTALGIPVVFTGCFVDSHPEFDRSTRRTTYLVDNRHKNTIPELLEAHFRGETVDPFTLRPDVFGFSTPGPVFHTRTNIKIQDGCDNYCSFCIIPRVRGPARSRSAEEVLREAREAIERGSRELVLTGVNMARYHDESRDDFVSLAEKILDLPGEFRLRISSLEPDGLDRRFIELFDHPRMCPHLHLCLQSGSDRVLTAMRRMYSRTDYRTLLEELRHRIPTFNVTTDLIVGFPGETEADFRDSLHAIREFHPGHVHLFPYSPRAGTAAAHMAEGVPNREKQRRNTLARALTMKEKRLYRESLVGITATVLVEKVEFTPEGAVARGLAEHYVPVRFFLPRPDTLNRDRLNGDDAVRGENLFWTVRITGIEPDRDEPCLLGEHRR